MKGIASVARVACSEVVDPSAARQLLMGVVDLVQHAVKLVRAQETASHAL